MPQYEHDEDDQHHQPHEKAVQLGVDLTEDDRTEMSDAEIDAMWAAGVPTVEECKQFLDDLAAGAQG